jgi:chemotaxis protein methyltransferase CheR
MPHEFQLSHAEFDEIRRRIYTQAGIALAETKRELVYTRLRKRLRHHGLSSFSEYLDLLAATPEELQAFINSLTTNHTAFFREPSHFTILRNFIQARASTEALRIWCAASSTGEEPYTIAIAVAESMRSLTPNATILATDIDTEVLNKANSGIYPVKAIESIERSMAKRYFLRGKASNKGLCRVLPELRRLIEFRQLNLLDSTWQADEYDVIFCRNVFFYFDKPTQYRILTRLRSHLKDDGIFFTGHSENFVTFAAESGILEAVGEGVYRPARRGAA